MPRFYVARVSLVLDEYFIQAPSARAAEKMVEEVKVGPSASTEHDEVMTTLVPLEAFPANVLTNRGITDKRGIPRDVETWLKTNRRPRARSKKKGGGGTSAGGTGRPGR